MSKNGRLDRCRIEIDRQDQIDVSLLLVPDKARGFRIHHVQSHFLIIDDSQRITQKLRVEADHQVFSKLGNRQTGIHRTEGGMHL